MKQKFWTAVLLLFSTFYLSAQIQDLANLAEGELEYEQILYTKNNEVYGYIYFFNQGKINNEIEKVEYVILDKKFHKISNGTFTREIFEYLSRTLTHCNFMDNDLLVNYELSNPAYDITICSANIINIRRKTIDREYWDYNDRWEDIPRTYEEYMEIMNPPISINSCPGL